MNKLFTKYKKMNHTLKILLIGFTCIVFLYLLDFTSNFKTLNSILNIILIPLLIYFVIELIKELISSTRKTIQQTKKTFSDTKDLINGGNRK